MAIIGSYDTDDLTQRQYHYFCKLGKNTVLAYSFLKSCVTRNHRLGVFDNYNGDCDFLFRHREAVEKVGINLDEVYS